jgi:tetratricopeptide (TPR) repeat protein
MASLPDAGAGLKIDTGRLKTISKEVFEKKPEGDILGSLGPLAEQSREATEALKVVDLSELKGFSAKTAESDVAGLINQAARHYALGQLSDALALLDKALEIDPGNLDALWLKAGCLVLIGEREIEALRVLRQLDADRDREREALRRQLYEATRVRLVPKTMLTAMLMLTSGDTEKVVTLTAQLADLDPGCGAYHRLLASALALEERHDEALAAIERGLERSGYEERAELEDLRRTILGHVVAEQMGAARALFLQGKYDKARAALRKLDDGLAETPLYRGFDGYLLRLEGDGGGPGSGRATVEPPGTPKEADAVYFFLVGDLIGEGKQQLEVELFDSAAESLERALGHCPTFPYANFLLGVALYGGLGKRISEGSQPDGDTVLATLERAHAALQVGCHDADVGGQASSFDEAVGELLASVGENKADADLINPIVEAYGRAMKKVGDGIASEKQLNQVASALRGVKASIEEVRGRLRTKEGKEALRQLSKQVDEHLKQLSKVEKQAAGSDAVAALVARFNDMMTSLQASPISSYSELLTAQSMVSRLRSDAESTQRTAKGPAAKQLKELLKAIKTVEKQLKG